jgi:hypothetical protein
MGNRYVYFHIWDLWSSEEVDYLIYEIWFANEERELRLSSQKEFRKCL